MLNLLERLAIWCAHEVVCVSKSLQKAARESGVLPAGRGVVLGAGSSNGVSTGSPPARTSRVSGASEPPTSPSPADSRSDSWAALPGTRVWTPWRRRSRRSPQAGLFGNCLVVGGNDARDSQDLRAALDGSGWSICHLGHVPDPIPAMSTLDVLCLPSRREGFPNVVLEAAMVGVPCVGSDATGMIDAVIDGVTGVTVPTEDARALARALADLMMHPEQRHRLGLTARRRAVAEFAREQVWAAQAAFLAAMLARTGAGTQPFGPRPCLDLPGPDQCNPATRAAALQRSCHRPHARRPGGQPRGARPESSRWWLSMVRRPACWSSPAWPPSPSPSAAPSTRWPSARLPPSLVAPSASWRLAGGVILVVGASAQRHRDAGQAHRGPVAAAPPPRSHPRLAGSAGRARGGRHRPDQRCCFAPPPWCSCSTASRAGATWSWPWA